MLAEKRQSLEKARPDFPAFDLGDLASREMKQRVNRRRGKNLGQDFEDFFPPSTAGQPIMNQSHFQGMTSLFVIRYSLFVTHQ